MLSMPHYCEVWFYLNNEIYKQRFYSKILRRKRLKHVNKVKTKPLFLDKRGKLHKCRNLRM